MVFGESILVRAGAGLRNMDKRLGFLLPHKCPRVWFHYFALSGILILAILVRLPGLLLEPALGQTDAYTHLQFLQDMAQHGVLRHPNYPVGFYYFSAIPVRFFHWGPYLVARYGGIVYGLGFVLSSHHLLLKISDEKCALWGGYFLAGFPAFYWLQKTSLGLYPIQLGLLLLPLLLLTWWQALSGSRLALFHFALTSLFLGVSTPMMLLDLLPFLMGHVLWCLVRRKLPSQAIWSFMIAAVGILVGVTFLFVRGGESAFRGTLGILAGRDYSQASALAAFWDALRIYVLPKRFLPSSPLVAFCAISAGIFVFIFSFWLRHRNSILAWLGTWTFFCWLQTVFACFQFPGYFRAGWPFLLGFVFLGAAWMREVHPLLPRGIRRLSLIIVFASPLGYIWFYPRLSPHLSPCESDLVTFARQFSSKAVDEFPHDAKVWSRRWNYFDEHLGDPLYALWQGYPEIDFETLSKQEAIHLVFDPSRSHLVLLDDHATHSISYGLMGIVDPKLVRNFSRDLERSLDISRVLRSRVEALDPKIWRIESHHFPQGLEVLTISPITPAVPSTIPNPVPGS
jgi:hypothetical protein